MSLKPMLLHYSVDILSVELGKVVEIIVRAWHVQQQLQQKKSDAHTVRSPVLWHDQILGK